HPAHRRHQMVQRKQLAGPILLLLLAWAVCVSIAPAAPLAQVCTPRPHVDVTVGHGADDRLQIDIAANGAGNFLRELRFGTATGALIDVGDRRNALGDFTIALPPGTPHTTFTVRQMAPGQAVTVPLIVADGCGDWPTFVGGGPSAFLGPTPTATLRPPGTATPTVTFTATPTATLTLRTTWTPTATATMTRTATPMTGIIGPRAYVANFGSNTPHVVATVSIGVTTALGFLPRAPRDVAVTRDGRRAYVTHDQAETISIIDTATNQLVNTIQVPASSFGRIVASPTFDRVYAANETQGGVVIIDTNTNQVVARVALGGVLGGGGAGIAWDLAVGHTGSPVLAVTGDNALWTVSETSGVASSSPIELINGAVADGVAVEPVNPLGVYQGATWISGSRSHPILGQDYGVWRFPTLPPDTLSDHFQPFTAQRGSGRMAVTQLGTRVLVVNTDSQTLSVLNYARGEIVHLPVGSGPRAVAASPDGTRAYVTNALGGNVAVVDNVAWPPVVLTAVPVGLSPQGIAIKP